MLKNELRGADLGYRRAELRDQRDQPVTANPNNDIMLKALMRYIVSHFDREAVVHVLNNDEVTADLNR